MHLPRLAAGLAAVLAVGVMTTACATGTADAQPTVRASGSPPPTAPPESNAPSLPSATPSTPAGETPSSSPDDDDEPALQVGYRARATANGIAVRQGPGTDQPLISEENTDTGEVLEAVRLEAGDPVVIQLGPVRLDGFAWYWVTDDDGDRISWRDGGWVAGEYLEGMEAVETFPTVVVAVNGVGESVTEPGTIEPGADIRYHLMAAPPDGASSCEIRVSIAGVEPGQRELVMTSISEATFFPEGASEFMSVTGGGEVELTVHTDCSYAGVVTEATQG